jgi:hypothetical protein
MTTDGDAERALEQFNKEVSEDGCIDAGFHQLKVFHPDTVKTIKRALQTRTPPVPVDTTDGDALEAFSDLIDYYEASACGKIAMRYAKFGPKIAYKTVKAALQSTRKPINEDAERAKEWIKSAMQMDTVEAMREVLMSAIRILSDVQSTRKPENKTNPTIQVDDYVVDAQSVRNLIEQRDVAEKKLAAMPDAVTVSREVLQGVAEGK